MSTLSPIRSQLIRWTFGQDALPDTYDVRAAKDAMAVIVSRCRRLLRLPDPTWEEGLQAFDLIARVDSLTEWVSMNDPKESRVTALAKLWGKSEVALYRQLSRGPMRTALRRWAKHPPSAGWHEALVSWEQSLDERENGGVAESYMADRRFRRVMRDLDHPRMGVDFSDKEWGEIPAAFRADIEQAYRTTPGWNKHWLPYRHPLLIDLIPHFSDEQSREMVWCASQDLGARPGDLRQLLAYRKGACRRGETVADRQLSTHAEPRSTFVRRTLLRVLSSLALSNQEQQALWQRRADNMLVAVDATKPWNAIIVCADAASDLGEVLPSRSDLFPIVPTVLQAVPEILTAVGWTCSSASVPSSDRVVFEAQRADGHPVSIVVRPWARHDDAGVDRAAYTVTLSQSWPAVDHATSAGLSLCLPAGRTCLTREDLVNLAHELGHLVHFQEMPGRVSGEQQLFPADMLEFPSQLLERYVTPDRLAAWVRKTAAAGYKEADYWLQTLAPDRDPWRLSFLTQDLVASCLDFQAHSGGRLRFEQEHAHLRHLAGLPPADPRATDHHLGVVWDSDYAARRYVYAWGQFLIARILPAAASATTVARTYRGFLDHVGREAVTAHQVRRAWRVWTDESLAASVAAGSQIWAQNEVAVASRLQRHLASGKSLAAARPRRPSLG